MPSADYFMQQRRAHVRNLAALGASGATPPPTIGPGTASPSGPATFRVVTLEHPPSLPLAEDPRLRGLGGEVGLSGEWLERALELVEQVDGVRCWRCGVPVGLVTTDDLEPGERIAWREASLVSGSPGGDPVSVQCEECAPATCPEPWPEGRAPGWAAMRPDHCWTAPDGFTQVHVHDPGAATCRCTGTGWTAPRTS